MVLAEIWEDMWQQSIFSSFSYFTLLAVWGNVPIEQFSTKANKTSNNVLPSDIRRTIKDKIKTVEEQEVAHLWDRNGLCTSWAIMIVAQMGKKGHTGFCFVDEGRHRLAVDIKNGLIIDSSAYEPVKLEGGHLSHKTGIEYSLENLDDSKWQLSYKKMDKSGLARSHIAKPCAGALAAIKACLIQFLENPAVVPL
jgi:hypothetical protein